MHDLAGAVSGVPVAAPTTRGYSVEVADNLVDVHGLVGVRDSKDQDPVPHSRSARRGGQRLIGAIRAGRFER